MKMNKKIICMLTTVFFTAFGSISVIAEQMDDPKISAKKHQDLQIAVAQASNAWKNAFNAGDAAGATAMYEEDAIMVVKPFGTFRGKDEILAFWTNLVNKGFDDVVYDNTVTTLLDNNSARIVSDWKMNNAHGVITNELWVLQSDGRALLREDHFEVAQ